MGKSEINLQVDLQSTCIEYKLFKRKKIKYIDVSKFAFQTKSLFLRNLNAFYENFVKPLIAVFYKLIDQ